MKLIDGFYWDELGEPCRENEEPFAWVCEHSGHMHVNDEKRIVRLGEAECIALYEFLKKRFEK